MVIRQDGVIGYGWAICSPDDPPFYGKVDVAKELPYTQRLRWVRGGRTIAHYRALAALRRGVQVADGVWRYARRIARREALEVIELCNANGLLVLVWHNSVGALPKDMQPPPKAGEQG